MAFNPLKQPLSLTVSFPISVLCLVFISTPYLSYSSLSSISFDLYLAWLDIFILVFLEGVAFPSLPTLYSFSLFFFSHFAPCHTLRRDDLLHFLFQSFSEPTCPCLRTSPPSTSMNPGPRPSRFRELRSASLAEITPCQWWITSSRAKIISSGWSRSTNSWFTTEEQVSGVKRNELLSMFWLLLLYMLVFIDIFIHFLSIVWPFLFSFTVLWLVTLCGGSNNLIFTVWIINWKVDFNEVGIRVDLLIFMPLGVFCELDSLLRILFEHNNNMIKCAYSRIVHY